MWMAHPLTTTQSFTCSAAEYALVVAWLTAATPAIFASHGIASWVGQHGQHRITITSLPSMTGFDTDIPIPMLPL